jgi:hypothetical protein
MKPIFLPVLFQVICVPTATQKIALFLASWVLGVEEAPLAVRFTSTMHGVEADPQVLRALHNCTGFGSEHAYLLLFDCAIVDLARNMSGNASKIHLTAKHRWIVIAHLTLWHSSRHN